MKRIAFITLGCKLNYAETSTYERALLKEGFEAVSWTKGADVFLVNTCTVTEHSDKKSRNIIRKLHRQNPDSLIFVTGCYAQLKKAEIEAIEGVTAASLQRYVARNTARRVQEGSSRHIQAARELDHS